MTLLSSSPQHCLKGEGGEIKIILDCFQIGYYDLTISLNLFCEGLYTIMFGASAYCSSVPCLRVINAA